MGYLPAPSETQSRPTQLRASISIMDTLPRTYTGLVLDDGGPGVTRPSQGEYGKPDTRRELDRHIPLPLNFLKTVRGKVVWDNHMQYVQQVIRYQSRVGIHKEQYIIVHIFDMKFNITIFRLTNLCIILYLIKFPSVVYQRRVMILIK